MTEEQNEVIVSWEDADIKESKYVKFEKDAAKTITITNWVIVEKVDKFGEDGDKKRFFNCDVLEEDGVEVVKIIDMSSNPFRHAVKPHLFSVDKTSIVKLKITKSGEGTKTEYKAEKVEE